jgi:hypothetical protein
MACGHIMVSDFNEFYVLKTLMLKKSKIINHFYEILFGINLKID